MGDVKLIKVATWAEFPWLRHGFSTRQGGTTTVYGGRDLNLGFTADDSENQVLANREIAVDSVAPGAVLVTVRQVHEINVVLVDEDFQPVEADGMMTDRAGVVLGIQVADCVPLLLADTRQRVVAALHAGWRGTVTAIAGIGVARVGEEFTSRPEDLMAAIGPSIGPCCYTVGEELIDRVGWDSGLLKRRNGAVYFDLWEANRRQLLAAGVERVTVLGLCTACARVDGHRRFFSHRAEAGRTGRGMGLIAVA